MGRNFWIFLWTRTHTSKTPEFVALWPLASWRSLALPHRSLQATKRQSDHAMPRRLENWNGMNFLRWHSMPAATRWRLMIFLGWRMYRHRKSRRKWKWLVIIFGSISCEVTWGCQSHSTENSPWGAWLLAFSWGTLNPLYMACCILQNHPLGSITLWGLEQNLGMKVGHTVSHWFGPSNPFTRMTGSYGIHDT